jgi:FlaA1/EpsC-like NDP-sugar epimerase
MKRFVGLHHYLLSLPRWAKRAILWGIDLAILPVCYLLAYMLRFSKLPAIPIDWHLLVIAPVLSVVALQLSGYYRVVIRYIDFNALKAIALGQGLAVMGLYTSAFLLQSTETPRSIFFIYAALAGIWLLFSRLLARAFLQASGRIGSNRTPVVIYGAGSAGMQTASSLKHEDQFEPLAFIDDLPSMKGQLVSGLPVFGRRTFSAWLAKNPQVQTALLAMPSASDDQRREALQFLQPFGLAVKTLPGLSDLVSGRAKLSDVHDVRVSDLLSRSAVSPDDALMSVLIRGSRVLVTGAGGSIGSELCKQILRLKPEALVLLDVSEYALYQIEQTLLGYPGTDGIAVVSVLGSVLDAGLLSRIMAGQRVRIVFHAAAYKHVPLVEANIGIGVANNAFGTLIAAEAARSNGVERFILVSTDKAVRPTNVMGASKRLAELVLQAMAGEGGRTRFSMVRFGNVLDSSGSVVPRFREQIQAGGPVTVTHPDITRYFMTIPEAASLVIQAGAMAEGGEVFLLDMGEPVKIDQLARTMIQLMGRTVMDASGAGDIEIRYSGLRPGEKLYEELLIDADADATRHPKIFRAREASLPMADLRLVLDALQKACSELDAARICTLLATTVSGYRQEERVVDPFWR